MSTVLAFLFTIGLLVTVHEWGHYRAARACGVKVLRFSIGFGKPLLRWQRGETEFVLALLPLGGYVKMLDEREGPVDPSEHGRAFNRKPLLQRAFVVAAGPAVNLLLAVLLYAAMHLIGIEEALPILGSPQAGSLAADAGLQAGDRVLALRRTEVPAARPEDSTWHPVPSYAELRWQLTEATLDRADLRLRVEGPAGPRELVLPLSRLDASEVDAGLGRRIGLSGPYSAARIGSPRPEGPAARAGLREGDQVLAIDDQPVADAVQLRERIRAAGIEGGMPRALNFRIERDGRELSVRVQPRLGADGGPPVPRIEALVGGVPEQVLLRQGPVDALRKGVERTVEVAVLSLRMLGRMLIGEASLKNLSGPLTIADAAGQTARSGLIPFLGFLALVSVSRGVLNLLPLPMLDGGHLVYYIVEGFTGRPISEAWLDRLQRGGLAIMVLMMSLAFYNDLARLLGQY